MQWFCLSGCPEQYGYDRVI
ncbi:MAG TPA: hypothetical protein DCG22_10025 [Bacteroidetes bacterium]|nr:hypothetical protein [Bacteroidota bacterium]